MNSMRAIGKLRNGLTYANVMATAAAFLALSTGGAYAANTILSADIKDGEVKTPDVASGAVTTEKVKDESLTNADIKNFSLGNGDFLTGSVDSRAATDNSLTGDDIKNFSLGNGDFLTGSVDSRAATDNSLTGADVNESTLNMPPTTTATFAGSGRVALNRDGSQTKVLSKNLPAGSYAVIATANLRTSYANDGDQITDARCELRSGNSYMGEALDRRYIPDDGNVMRSLSLNGGAQVPAGGGELSLWCSSQVAFAMDNVHSSQMMILRLDGFS